jgi:putative transcriptional regulator
MRSFTINLRGWVLACALAVSSALIAITAPARDAHSADVRIPSFLVATRDMQDPFFQHSVILMLPSTEPPLVAGLIINTPAKERIRDIFPQARQLKAADQAMYLGGPVEPEQASVVFRAPSAIGSATRIIDDTYLATGYEAIVAILKDPRISALRVIAGKAQWTRDQLNNEVMEGSWYVVPANSDLVFSDPKDLWSTLVKGGEVEEAEAGQVLLGASADAHIADGAPLLWESEIATQNLPFSRLDGTNWQRRISPN